MSSATKNNAMITFDIEINRLKELKTFYQNQAQGFNLNIDATKDQKLFGLINDLTHQVNHLKQEGSVSLSKLTYTLQVTNGYLSNPKDQEAKNRFNNYAQELTQSSGNGKLLGNLLVAIGVSMVVFSCLSSCTVVGFGLAIGGLGFFAAGLERNSRPTNKTNHALSSKLQEIDHATIPEPADQPPAYEQTDHHNEDPVGFPYW